MLNRKLVIVCGLVAALSVVSRAQQGNGGNASQPSPQGNAQQPAPQTPAAGGNQQGGQPTFRTGINFVRVDVFATVQGKPVKDLTALDFDLREDGVPQKVSTFEHVEVRTGAAQELRQEPNTIIEARDALRNPRAMVFVLFLDTSHVSVEGGWQAREPATAVGSRAMPRGPHHGPRRQSSRPAGTR